MKLILVTTLLVVALQSIGLGQTRDDTHPRRHSADVEEVMQLQHKIAAAIVKSDTSFMRSIYAPEYIFINGAGVVKGRAQVLDGNQSGAILTASLRYDDMRVRIYGGVAIITGVATVTTLEEGQSIKGRSRFTRVQVKVEGHWQVVLYHVTRIAE